MKAFGKWFWYRTVFRVILVLLMLLPKFGLTFFLGTVVTSVLLFGQIQLNNPLAGIQVILASPGSITLVFLFSTVLMILFYALSGRVFCSWLCPLGLLSELICKAKKPGSEGNANLKYWLLKYYLLALVLALSLLTGLPIFEIFSPMAVLMRLILFGIAVELFFLLAILLLDQIGGKRSWCNQLCPLGAFFSLLGRHRLWGVKFAKDKCTHCNICLDSCWVDTAVLKEAVNTGNARLIHMECTNCGDCISACPHFALSFGITVSKRGLSFKKASTNKTNKSQIKIR